MTLGFGPRTVMGVWIDTRQIQRRVVNILAFGWHWQFVWTVEMSRWRRQPLAESRDSAQTNGQPA